MILKSLLAAAGVVAVAACSPSGGDASGADAESAAGITVEDAWVRAPLAGRDATVGFFIIRNAGAADRLVAASCTCAERVGLHTHVHAAGGVMRMEPVDFYPAPANGEHTLTTGGDHLMLFGVAPDLGDTVDLTLTFEHAGDVTVSADVRALGE